jgi:hypothetical protein
VTLPSGCPMKLGMTNACGEFSPATSKLILGAEASFAFAGGSWATTCPELVPASRSVALELSSSPRCAMLIVAARSLSPTTCGIVTRCGPRLNASRTSQPRRTWVPAAGTCDRIRPSGVFSL